MFCAYSNADFGNVLGINATGAIVYFKSPAEYSNPFKAHHVLACVIRRSMSGSAESPDDTLKHCNLGRERKDIDFCLILIATKEFTFPTRLMAMRSTKHKENDFLIVRNHLWDRVLHIIRSKLALCINSARKALLSHIE